MITWNETHEKFLHITDKLGKPIDSGILDTVVALNMLGVVTRQSCEGHTDWGAPYPWIDIQAEIDQKFLLHTYLKEFYQNRVVNFDRVLVFHGYRMRPSAAPFETFFSNTEQQLQAYQQEMRDFTAFLKARINPLQG